APATDATKSRRAVVSRFSQPGRRSCSRCGAGKHENLTFLVVKTAAGDRFRHTKCSSGSVRGSSGEFGEVQAQNLPLSQRQRLSGRMRVLPERSRSATKAHPAALKALALGPRSYRSRSNWLASDISISIEMSA